MMKIEAEYLLGYDLCDEEFKQLNHVYMESTLDKQTVCKAWKELSDVRLLTDLADKVVHFREEYSKLAVSHRRLLDQAKLTQDLANRIQWMNVKMHGSYVVFDRERMKCVVFTKPSRNFFVGYLFNVPEHDKRLKYESKTPMPQEAVNVLALMGYEVDGPL